MEIKRPEEITEADIPKIESPFFASSRVERVFNEGFSVGIQGLDEIVAEYMPRFLGSDQKKLSAYWEYYKGGGKKRNWDYNFHDYNPVKDQVLKDFVWGKYLILLQTEYELFRCYTLFRKDEHPRVKIHDRWRQDGDALPSSNFMGFEAILNRIYPDRKRVDYHPFFGRPGSNEGEVAEEIILSPEPWPEQGGRREAFVASPTAQPSPNFAPNSQPAPQPTETQQPRKPANDPEFDVKKGLWLMRLLKGAGVAAILTELLFPENDIPQEWEDENGVSYEYNPDDFSFTITQPDGTKEQLVMYPDGTVMDNNGAIVGSTDKNGNFEPATEQEELDYRVWKANGGEGSFAVWKNSGKPVENDKMTGAKNVNINPSKTIGERKIINSDLAGQTVKTKGGDVKFDNDGFPDFTPYSNNTVQVDGLTGDMANDVPLAMKKAGLKTYDKKKYIWHHHQDGKSMMLVPRDVHSVRNGGVAHTGGRAVIEHNKNNPANQLNYPSPPEI